MRIVCALVSAGILAGCGGHGSSLLPQPKSSLSPSNKTTALMTVVIPAKAKSSSGRHTQYISPSTQSIGLNVNANDGNWQDQTTGYANVTPGSPGCSKDGNGNTTCALSFPAVGGSNVSYTVTAYDAPNGGGKTLAAASAQASWSYGTDNKFSITLDGIPTKFSLALSGSTIPQGTPVADALTVSAYDADGNLIVNSPSYADSSGNPTGAVTLVTTGIDGSQDFRITQNDRQLSPLAGSPGQYFLTFPLTNIAVHYNGSLPPASDPTLTLSAPGQTVNTATLHVGPATNSAAIMYAGGYNGYGYFGWLAGYPGGGADGNPDFAQIDSVGDPGMTCSQGGYFSGEATDANNNVGFIATGACNYQDIAAYKPGGGLEFDITGIGHPAGPGLLPENFISLGFDSSNNIYGFEDDGPVCANGCTTDIGDIDVLKAGSTGAFNKSTMDLRAIVCVNEPEAIAVAPDGTVYAAHVGDSHTPYEAIEVFAPGTAGYFECTGDEVAGTPIVTATRYIGGTNSGLNDVKQLAVDSKGNVYAANIQANSITVYGPTANGNVAPDRTITGPDTLINTPSGVAVDQYGYIYVANDDGALNGGRITVYAPNASGDAKPVRTVTTSGYLSTNMVLVK